MPRTKYLKKFVNGIEFSYPDWLFCEEEKKSSNGVSPAAVFDPVGAAENGAAFATSTSPSAALEKKKIILSKTLLSQFSLDNTGEIIAFIKRIQLAGFDVYLCHEERGENNFSLVEENLNGVFDKIQHLGDFKEKTDPKKLATTIGLGEGDSIALKDWQVRLFSQCFMPNFDRKKRRRGREDWQRFVLGDKFALEDFKSKETVLYPTEIMMYSCLLQNNEELQTEFLNSLLENPVLILPEKCKFTELLDFLESLSASVKNKQVFLTLALSLLTMSFSANRSSGSEYGQSFNQSTTRRLLNLFSEDPLKTQFRIKLVDMDNDPSYLSITGDKGRLLSFLYTEIDDQILKKKLQEKSIISTAIKDPSKILLDKLTRLIATADQFLYFWTVANKEERLLLLKATSFHCLAQLLSSQNFKDCKIDELDYLTLLLEKFHDQLSTEQHSVIVCNAIINLDANLFSGFWEGYKIKMVENSFDIAKVAASLGDFYKISQSKKFDLPFYEASFKRIRNIPDCSPNLYYKLLFNIIFKKHSNNLDFLAEILSQEGTGFALDELMQTQPLDKIQEVLIKTLQLQIEAPDNGNMLIHYLDNLTDASLETLCSYCSEKGKEPILVRALITSFLRNIGSSRIIAHKVTEKVSKMVHKIVRDDMAKYLRDIGLTDSEAKYAFSHFIPEKSPFISDHNYHKYSHFEDHEKLLDYATPDLSGITIFQSGKDHLPFLFENRNALISAFKGYAKDLPALGKYFNIGEANPLKFLPFKEQLAIAREIGVRSWAKHFTKDFRGLPERPYFEELKEDFQQNRPELQTYLYTSSYTASLSFGASGENFDNIVTIEFADIIENFHELSAFLKSFPNLKHVVFNHRKQDVRFITDSFTGKGITYSFNKTEFDLFKSELREKPKIVRGQGSPIGNQGDMKEKPERRAQGNMKDGNIFHANAGKILLGDSSKDVSYDMSNIGSAINCPGLKELAVRTSIIKISNIEESREAQPYFAKTFKRLDTKVLTQEVIEKFRSFASTDQLYFLFKNKIKAGERTRLYSVKANESFKGIFDTSTEVTIEKGDDDFLYATSKTDCTLKYIMPPKI